MIWLSIFPNDFLDERKIALTWANVRHAKPEKYYLFVNNSLVRCMVSSL